MRFADTGRLSCVSQALRWSGGAQDASDRLQRGCSSRSSCSTCLTIAFVFQRAWPVTRPFDRSFQWVKFAKIARGEDVELVSGASMRTVGGFHAK